MSQPARYVLACSTPWVWDRWMHARLPGEWLEVRQRSDLDEHKLREFGPRYVFFPRWSHRVPTQIVDEFECVCFHSTPLPYGRGGSPVQNMIVRGHKSTMLTALRMVEEIDAGPIYAQKPLSLLGTANEIFMRIAELSMVMMHSIIELEPARWPQRGETVTFRRRTPWESALPGTSTLEQLFDFIRMLDAEGYPHAFIDHGNHRLEFTRASLQRDHVEATVRIRLRKD